MDVACLNMRSQMAQLKLDTTQPTVNMDIKDPEIMINSQAATVEINRTEGQLHIDLTNWRAALGHKEISQLVADIAQKGTDGARSYVAAVKQEGKMMERPHDQTAIAEFAKQQTLDPWPEIGLAKVMPSEISYTPGELSIDATKGQLSIELNSGSVGIQLNRGKIRGYVDPKQSLEMWVTKNKYDIFR